MATDERLRVVVPYATLWPETKAALEADHREAEYHYVGGSPIAYHDLMLELWHSGQGFTVVEQDVVVYPGAIAELEACSNPWCGKSYWIGSSFDCYLGCTRFSTALVQANPGVMDALDGLRDDGTPRRYWGRLDTRLGQVLNDQVGIAICKHWPAVEHLNPDKALKGGINCSLCGEPIAWETAKRTPPPWPCEHDGPPLPVIPRREPEPQPTPPSGVTPVSNGNVTINCVYCGGPWPCLCR